MTALLEYMLSALLEYKQFFERAHAAKLNSVLGSSCKLQSPNFTRGVPEPLETPPPYIPVIYSNRPQSCNA